MPNNNKHDNENYENIISFIKDNLKNLEKNFKSTNNPQKFHFRKVRSLFTNKINPYTHQLHYYPAKVLVDIPNFFLFNDEYINNNQILLDPFAGSGTILLAGLVHPVYKINTLGVEINPLARLICKVKTTPLNIKKLERESARLLSNIDTKHGFCEIPKYNNLDFWFVKRAQKDLSKIKYFIDQVKDKEIQDFFYVCFSSIIRKSSLADPDVPPPVILKANHFKDKNQRKEILNIIKEKHSPKTISYFKKELEKNLKRIKSLSEILLNKVVESHIIWDDIRSLKAGKYLFRGLLDKENPKCVKDIDLIITSPPYINAQKYVRTLKLELLWLGLLSHEEIVELDRTSIGTERIYSDNYKEIAYIGEKLADKTIEKLYKINKRRAGIVSKYYADMHVAMKNIYNCLKSNGKFILIVGNNSILNHEVKNHQILINLATQSIGFKTKLIIRDNIISRGLFTKRHESADIISEEWIIIFNKP